MTCRQINSGGSCSGPETAPWCTMGAQRHHWRRAGGNLARGGKICTLKTIKIIGRINMIQRLHVYGLEDSTASRWHCSCQCLRGSANFSMQNNKRILTSYRTARAKHSQNDPNKGEHSRWSHSSWLEDLLRGYVSEDCLALAERRPPNPWNGSAHQDTKPWVSSWLSCDKGAGSMGRNSLFQKWCWDIWIAICKAMKSNYY